MFGTSEIIFIIIIALVLFGPDKLPELARTAGKAMAAFKNAQKTAELSQDFDLSGFDFYNEQHEAETKKENDILHQKVEAIAKTHGIDTENKTTEELLNLISEKIEKDEKTVIAEKTEENLSLEINKPIS
ncbi:MAG: twin-arginine translocase TatA/TatE family subunit [Methanosarcinaceae archaeon]|nr:twin-arginine translocase TatA/TatE family subunit [Methanosarcinaceae archaeon]